MKFSGHWAVAHWLSVSAQRVAWQLRRRSARNGIGKDCRPRKLAGGLDGGDGPRPRPSGPRRTRTARAMGTGWDGTVAHSNSMHLSTRAARLHSHSPLTAHRSPLDSAGRRLMSSSWCLVSGGAACSVAVTAVLFYSTQMSGAVPCCLTFY